MAFMKVKDLRNSATTANNTLTYMYIKLTCTVQGSFLEQHILWPDNLQTQSLRSQTCWRALLDAPEPGGLNTHTHRHSHMHKNTGCMGPYSSFSLCGATCYIKLDGVRGGPSPQWLVCLKPEVVLACIIQLHNPNLD